MYFDPERLRRNGGRTNCCVGVNRTTSPNLKPVTYLHSITFALINFIDLNQDGVLEVIIDTQKWEDVGAIIYQINGQDVIQVLPRESVSLTIPKGLKN